MFNFHVPSIYIIFQLIPSSEVYVLYNGIVQKKFEGDFKIKSCGTIYLTENVNEIPACM